MTSQAGCTPSIAEICASVKRLGYGISQSIRLYGEEFEVISDPFPASGGIAVSVKTKKSDVTRVVQLPATVLQSVQGRSAWVRMQSSIIKTMADRTDFVILRSVNKTPSMASCTKCRRKFFTPNSYYNDPMGAEQYLRTKFDLHDCLAAARGARSESNLESDSFTKPDWVNFGRFCGRGAQAIWQRCEAFHKLGMSSEMAGKFLLVMTKYVKSRGGLSAASRWKRQWRKPCVQTAGVSFLTVGVERWRLIDGL